MSAYVKGLEASHAAETADFEARQLLRTAAEKERLTPLDERLRRVLADIPEDVKREGLSLSALQSRLRGRKRETCHGGELGAALRRLGFRRERHWRGADGFRALWVKV